MRKLQFTHRLNVCFLSYRSHFFAYNLAIISFDRRFIKLKSNP